MSNILRACFVVLFLIGCTEEQQRRQAIADSAGGPFVVYVDQATGCHYIRGSSGGITIRLSSSGQPICGFGLLGKEPRP